MISSGDYIWRGRPFALQTDGDLWQMFWYVLASRNPNTVKVGWTKGHALSNREYMAQHPDKLIEATHNHRADNIATRAHAHFYNSHVIHLSSTIAQRIDDYVQFVQAVHQVIIRTYLASQKLKQSDAFKLLHPHLAINRTILFRPPPSFAQVVPTQPIECKVTSDMLDRYLHDASVEIRGLAYILTHVACTPAPPGQLGIAWIELLLLSMAAATLNHR
eukprot:7357954-Karenia_brevis.AAC.1